MKNNTLISPLSGYTVSRLPVSQHPGAILMAQNDGIETVSFRVISPSLRVFRVDLYVKTGAEFPHGWEATTDKTTNQSGYYTSGSLAFDDEKTLQDYDGVFFLPKCVCAVLRANGFTVDDICLAEPLE